MGSNNANYSSSTVAAIQNARSELKQNSAVRFLNRMTETASGLTPVTAVLSVGMKPGFVWSEQTLRDLSANLMRDARLAVVPCSSAAVAGNVDVLDSCTSTSAGEAVLTVIHTVSQVTWVYDPASATYVAQGSYTYDYTSTTTGSGSSCTVKKTAVGNIAGNGKLIVISNPAAQNALGYGYTASGDLDALAAVSNGCAGTADNETVTVTWLPLIKAFTGTGGSYDGETVTPICGGSGTETVTWSFSVPPQ